MNNIGTKELETKRLILRKLTINDAKEMYDNCYCNEEVSKYVLFKKHDDITETIKLYEMWIKEYDELTTYRWIVETKDTHELVGVIDVASKKFINHGSCEIGYCYSNKFWNKGYGTEILKRVIKFLFEEVEVDTIYAEHLVNNPASGKVMEKSGMIYEGTLRSRIIDKDGIRNDLKSYSITKEDYFKSL